MYTFMGGVFYYTNLISLSSSHNNMDEQRSVIPRQDTIQ